VILILIGFLAGIGAMVVAGELVERHDRRKRAARYDPHASPDWSKVTVPSALPAELPASHAILEPPYPPGARLVRDDHPFDL
jgi:hypothetical protein